MNGEQQATQHTPTLTARQGTPSTTNTPTTQATTYAETGRPRGRFLRDVSLATDHGSSNATSLESRSPAARLRATSMRPRESRQPPQAATRMTKGPA